MFKNRSLEQNLGHESRNLAELYCSVKGGGLGMTWKFWSLAKLRETTHESKQRFRLQLNLEFIIFDRVWVYD